MNNHTPFDKRDVGRQVRCRLLDGTLCRACQATMMGKMGMNQPMRQIAPTENEIDSRVRTTSGLPSSRLKSSSANICRASFAVRALFSPTSSAGALGQRGTQEPVLRLPRIFCISLTGRVAQPVLRSLRRNERVS